MTVHRYPVKSVVGDYLKAGAGLVLSLGIVFSGPLPWFLAVLFGGLVLLFLMFALRTLERHHLEVRIDDRGVATRIRPANGPATEGRFSRFLPWRGLRGVKLRYFGTRRHHRKNSGDGSKDGGFMQLTLTGTGGTSDTIAQGSRRKLRMSFESSLDGFAGITARAIETARAQGLKIDPVTLANLRVLGVDPEVTATDTAPDDRNDP